jgi:hypothetical protein
MGSRCPEPEHVSEMGESLLDCHALALARRAFIQYVFIMSKMTTTNLMEDDFFEHIYLMYSNLGISTEN